eukprot:scaffold4106_cov75-Skeletonema_dohrnii-CCMP3373.AAC.1
MLSDGITVQIASHCFYFLLPKNVDAANSQKSIKVTLTKTVVKVLDGGSAAALPPTIHPSSSNHLVELKNPNPPPHPPIIMTCPLRPLSNPKQTRSYCKCYPKPPKVTDGINTVKTLERHWPHVPKMNRDFTGVTQRDVMNWINKDSDTFGKYEKMMLRKIEPKSFGIAMGKAIKWGALQGADLLCSEVERV